MCLCLPLRLRLRLIVATGKETAGEEAYVRPTYMKGVGACCNLEIDDENARVPVDFD